MKVLLVDDELKFGTMLAKRLELRGIQTEYVTAGNDAVEKVKSGRKFDVAVLDVKMPGIDGFELKRRLKALDADLKFIFLTGHGSTIEGTDSGEDTAVYLPKPLNIEILLDALHTIFTEKSGE